MFWKKGNGQSAAVNKPAFKSWSLSRRLTVYYALSAFFILNLSAALVHWGLVSITTRQSNIYLQDEISVIEALNRSKTESEALAQKLEVGYAARESMKTYARILDPQGQVLLQTYGMSTKLPREVFPTPQKDRNSPNSVQWENSRHEVFLLQSISLDKWGRTLQIGLNITYLEHMFADFRDVLLAVIALGTAISVALAAFTVKRGLRPLLEISERAASITAYNLDKRVTLHRWPEEVLTVASALDLMLERLKDSFDRLSSYVSNMAHELRTPISILMGEAEVALTQSRTASDYRRVIESNLEEYERLARIIDSLLFIARTDIQKSDLERDEVDVCREIEKIIEYYLPIAEDKGLVLTCQENAILYADRTLFRRAISNLISNSLHYTEAGGRITISTKQAPDRAIEVIIADTGCGISGAELPNITDRFYRVDSTRHMNKEGTGLGLAIVKSIMELHGGEFRIESKQGKGTTITLIFPRSDITNLSS